MAIIEKRDPETHKVIPGSIPHLTGSDARVSSIIQSAKKSGKFGFGKFFDYDAFNEFSETAKLIHSKSQSVITTPTSASKQAFAPDIISKQADWVSRQKAFEGAIKYQTSAALKGIGLSVGDDTPIMPFDPNESPLIKRERIHNAIALKTRSDIEKRKAIEKQTAIDASPAKYKRDMARFDLQQKLRPKIGKISGQQKKEEIDIVAKGTERGIRKISGGNQVLSAASWLALGKLAQKGFGAVVGNEIRGAQFGQSMTNMALMSGADPETIAKWGFALKRFGGNEATASKLFAGITQLRQGALMGEDSPYMQAAMKYGLDLTGSGQGGIATEEEMLDRIAEFFRGDHTKEEKWHMAQILGMDASAQRLFSKDKSELDKILLDSSIVDKDTINNLNQTQEKYNELVSNLQQHLLVIADKTDVFDYWLNVAKSLSGVLESIEKYFEKEANKEFTEGTTIQDLPWYTRALLFFSGEDTSAIGGQSLDQKMALWSQIASPMAPVGMYTPFTTSSVNGNVDVTVTVKDQNGNTLPSDTSSSVSAESVINQAE